MDVGGGGWGVGGWGWGWFQVCPDGGGGGWGYAPHTCAHICTCMHGKHDNFMQMATPIGGIHGNPL